MIKGIINQKQFLLSILSSSFKAKHLPWHMCYWNEGCGGTTAIKEDYRFWCSLKEKWWNVCDAKKLKQLESKSNSRFNVVLKFSVLETTIFKDTEIFSKKRKLGLGQKEKHQLFPSLFIVLRLQKGRNEKQTTKKLLNEKLTISF